MILEDEEQQPLSVRGRNFQVRESSSIRQAKAAVRWLSFCFFLVFAAFQAAQGLQSTLNDILGIENLLTLYLSFSISLLFAPQIVRKLENKFGGLPWVLLIGGLTYFVAITANFIPVIEDLDGGLGGGSGLRSPGVDSSSIYETMEISKLIYLISFGLLGVGASLIWTAQSEYVGRCSLIISSKAGATLASSTSELNSLFFRVFQFSGVAGTATASLVFYSRNVLFGFLGFVSLLGCFAFLGLPNVGPHTPHTQSSIHAQGILLCGTLKVSFSRDFLPLLPSLFANGLTLGMFLGSFPEIIKEEISASYVPILLCIFYATNGLFTNFWSRKISTWTAQSLADLRLLNGPSGSWRSQDNEWRSLGSSVDPRRGRVEDVETNEDVSMIRGLEESQRILSEKANVMALSKASLISSLLILVFCGIFFMMDWRREIPEEIREHISIFVFLIGAILFGIGDSFFESQLPAAVQSRFQSQKDSALIANAAFKFWQSVGFATHFCLSLFVPWKYQLCVVAGFVCLASWAIRNHPEPLSSSQGSTALHGSTSSSTLNGSTSLSNNQVSHITI